MQRIRFFSNNILDAGTCTSSSVDSSRPLTNLLHDWYTKYNRTTGVSSEWWKWDLGATPPSFDGIMFKGHNFRVGSTVRIQADADDSSWGSPTVNELITITTAMLEKELIFKFWSSPQTYQWIRLYVEDVGNPAGYLQLGRPWAGEYFEPAVNFENAYIRGLEDFSFVEWSETGYHFASKVSAKSAILSYRFSHLSNSDRLSLLSLFQAVGWTNAYFILQDADDAVNTLFYGVNLDKIWNFEHVFMDQDFNFGFSFKESR
jgi:hypothetical protein